MPKRIIGMFLCVVLLLGLVGCKTTEKEFIAAVENYQIFDDDNPDGMKTVGDFINTMQSFEKKSNKKIHINIHTLWSEEKQKDSFIKYIKQNEGFVFDKKKYYGKLYVHVVMYSPDDYSTKEDYTCLYLFSLDKTGAVHPEAAASFYNGNRFDDGDITVKSSDVQLKMDACVLLTTVVKDHYSE